MCYISPKCNTLPYFPFVTITINDVETSNAYPKDANSNGFVCKQVVIIDERHQLDISVCFSFSPQLEVHLFILVLQFPI